MDRSCLKRLVWRSVQLFVKKSKWIPQIAGYPEDVCGKQEKDGYCDSRVRLLKTINICHLYCCLRNIWRCSYRTSGSSLTIHGRVTDFQMWNKVLPESQLKQVSLGLFLPDLTWLDSYPDHLLQITSCRLFKEGNLVSWLGDNWHLNSSRGTVSHPSRICFLWVTILLIWS